MNIINNSYIIMKYGCQKWIFTDRYILLSKNRDVKIIINPIFNSREQYEQQNYKKSMSRQQLLFKLLEKAEKSNQYVYSQLYEMTQSSSPPATIKRMQILQMGSCKINAPPQKNHDQQIFQKHTSASNRRVLILQKVKNSSKSKQTDKNNQDNLNFTSKIKGQFAITSITQPFDSKQIQTVKTEAESPLRQGAIKRTLCLSESTRNNKIKKQVDNFAVARSEKNCIFKSIQYQSETSRNIIKPTTSSTNTNTVHLSRGRRQSESSFNKDDQKKNKMLFRKEVNKNYQTAFSPPPKITAKSFIVYEIYDGYDKQGKSNIKIHTAFNSKVRVEIASLTKIMTCILAIEICSRFNFKATNQQIKIGKFQSSIGGTSANIQIDDVYTLHDLLHGLMLPSGNDASLAIAVWGGKKLIQNKQIMEGKLSHRKKMKKQCYDRFIQEMNVKASALGMTKTNYANSHGLINLLNRSCAHDVAILSHYCMKNNYFCSIVSCKQYNATIRVETKVTKQSKQEPIKAKPIQKIMNDQQHQYSDLDSQTCSETSHNDFKQSKKQESQQVKNVQYEIIVSSRKISWENTHKLLHKNSTEYLGIKTGITTAAGPCLSSCVLTPCGRKLFIVVLNCKKVQMRFKQTEILKKWVYKKQGIGKKSQRKKSVKSEIDNSDKQSEPGDLGQKINYAYD